MKRCPACNARYRGKENCHRCGMNITKLIEIKNQAQVHYQQAIKHFFKSEFEEMFVHARRAWS
ncbi:NosL, partial [Candidatus Magnetomorum sp. HK-1]